MITTVQFSVYRPKFMSFRSVSRKLVTRSYTSEALSPLGKRKKNRPNPCRSFFSSAMV
ncbi:hypothetical protein D3C86_2175830 [compost metagenome]